MGNRYVYPIVPCPKPRMSRSDRWKQRPCVLRYRAFCDEVRLRKIELPTEGASVQFILPMPKSWNEKKRAAMLGQPNTQKPDLSNLIKALEDAVYADDSTIWHYASISKVWGEAGGIVIQHNGGKK